MAARIAAAAANSNPYRKRAAREDHYDPYHAPAKRKPEAVKGNIFALKVFLPRKPQAEKPKPCQHQQYEPGPPTSN